MFFDVLQSRRVRLLVPWTVIVASWTAKVYAEPVFPSGDWHLSFLYLFPNVYMSMIYHEGVFWNSTYLFSLQQL